MHQANIAGSVGPKGQFYSYSSGNIVIADEKFVLKLTRAHVVVSSQGETCDGLPSKMPRGRSAIAAKVAAAFTSMLRLDWA